MSPEEGYKAARAAVLAMLASLKVYLDDLDRVSSWLMVNGLVNATPGFGGTTNAVNGFSDLILELYGLEAGMHARTAIGVSSLPLNLPVIISAEVALS
ncbi:MAG TPA: RidA family protein [Rubrobacteraceae bacterium]|nr:RidA family protein [Rubrobacteraceae bacterium]